MENLSNYFCSGSVLPWNQHEFDENWDPDENEGPERENENDEDAVPDREAADPEEEPEWDYLKPGEVNPDDKPKIIKGIENPTWP